MKVVGTAPMTVVRANTPPGDDQSSPRPANTGPTPLLTRGQRTAYTGTARHHQPQRPSWDCGGCGHPWPCHAARARLGLTLPPVQLALNMAACMSQAAGDLDDDVSPTELWDRFLGWTRR